MAEGGLFCYYIIMHEQCLPTYIHNFINDNRWVRHSSAHYVFHYFLDSEAERDIDYIIERQEKAYNKVVNFLGIASPDKQIHYYFYPDPETKRALMGDDWYAQSIYNEFRIHVLYTSEVKPIGEHEDTHLLSLPWGLSIGFFQEGLVEYIAGHAWDGKSHEVYVKEGYAQKILPSLVELMTHNEWVEKSSSHTIYFYSLAGAFVSFLVNQFGKERLELFYRQTRRDYSKEKNMVIFEDTFGKRLEAVENEFLEWLNPMSSKN